MLAQSLPGNDACCQLNRADEAAALYSCAGTSVSECSASLFSSGSGKVVPRSHGWNWSRYQGELTLPDSPVTILAMVADASERSAVKRSLGPKLTPMASIVVESPPAGCAPLPVAVPSSQLRYGCPPKRGCSISM